MELIFSRYVMFCPALASSVDPDQLASEEANWSGSAMFVIQYVNMYQQENEWKWRNRRNKTFTFYPYLLQG